ncbi:MAG: ATP-binding protein [Rickettsiaceae bacterium]
MNRQFILFLITIAISLSLFTYFNIIYQGKLITLDTSQFITLILLNLSLVLIAVILITYKLLRPTPLQDYHFQTSKQRLQKRIIMSFTIVAAIPTIIISVFSAYFFNFGIQAWFDKKIINVLDQSILVATSYIDEQKSQLKESTISLADDLNEMYYELMHNQTFFNRTLNAEAEMRSITEIIVFQKSTSTILAQTDFSFSLSFLSIPMHLMEKAYQGDIPEIKSDPNKIRLLIKLREYDDTYMIVGRFIDSTIINHIDQTNGAAQQYYDLRDNINNIQIKFSAVFIFISLMLLTSSIAWGAIIAGQIVSPIKKLVTATQKVQKGDLTVQVPEERLNDDEIKLLSRAFNAMVKRIDKQQKDLIIAQRSLAWSDVARRVAHEIKNPLTPIVLAIERLLRKFKSQVQDQEQFVRYTDIIKNNTNDIGCIVNEFVEFARMPLPSFTKCDLVVLVRDLVNSQKLINENIEYNFYSNQSKIHFICDTSQITRAINNIFKNSQESLSNPSVTQVSSHTNRIDVYLKQNNNMITITIDDNGSGFYGDLAIQALVPYVTTKNKGTGLGLAIVQKIIQDHFGLIEIGNNQNGGARIELIFDFDQLVDKLT